MFGNFVFLWKCHFTLNENRDEQMESIRIFLKKHFSLKHTYLCAQIIYFHGNIIEIGNIEQKIRKRNGKLKTPHNKRTFGFVRN